MVEEVKGLWQSCFRVLISKVLSQKDVLEMASAAFNSDKPGNDKSKRKGTLLRLASAKFSLFTLLLFDTSFCSRP